MPPDEKALARIKALVDAEHELVDRRERNEIGGPEELDRLNRREVECDRCWDLFDHAGPSRTAEGIPPGRLLPGPLSRWRDTDTRIDPAAVAVARV